MQGCADAGQVIFATDELKKKAGIPTKAEWAAQYNAPMEGSLPPGVPAYDPLLGAGGYNSNALSLLDLLAPSSFVHMTLSATM